MDDWGSRLVYERQRIGMNQTKFADAIGVSRQSQSLYEKSTVSPSSDYWKLAAQIGVDLQYVFTGVRSLNWPVSEDKKQGYMAKTDLINTLEIIRKHVDQGVELLNKID